MGIVYGEPDPVAVELEAALTRILATTSCPLYLRTAAGKWLEARA